MAATNSTNYTEDDLYENRINQFIKSHKGNDYSILSAIPLYDSNNHSIAKCYFLQPEGYAIIDRNMEIVEGAFSNTKSCQSLKEQTGKMVYYGGPFNYYSKTDDIYCNIIYNKYEEKGSVDEQISFFSEKMKKNKEEKSPTQSYLSQATPFTVTTTKLPGTLRTYSYNTGVICGSTAAAILLMYYREYRDISVVPSWHDTPTGQTLIDFLVPQINGNPPQGAWCTNVVNGLNYYFGWRGLSGYYNASWSRMGNYGADYSFFESLIRGNRPIAFLINNHPKYGNHFVVSHGVEKEIHGSTYYYIYANDGWGSNNVLISFSYLREYAYVNR